VEYALVSGGAGFIGSHLCAALLERGLGVICLDNLSTGLLGNLARLTSHPHFVFERVDVAEDDIHTLVLDHLHVVPAYIFHLASPASVVDYLRLPTETLRVNSEGTRRLLELARHMSSRFLYTSTSEIYGDPLVHPQPESYWGNVNPNGPRSCYDESKRFGEAITAQYGRSFGLDTRIVRIFNILMVPTRGSTTDGLYPISSVRRCKEPRLRSTATAHRPEAFVTSVTW
jgi:dTDP-glucose 4,6-dehydratase